MILLLLSIASLLLYGKSKYFPKAWQPLTASLRRHKQLTRLVAYGLYLIVAVVYVLRWDALTGLTIWLFALMLMLCLILIAVPTFNWLAEQQRD